MPHALRRPWFVGKCRFTSSQSISCSTYAHLSHRLANVERLWAVQPAFFKRSLMFFLWFFQKKNKPEYLVHPGRVLRRRWHGQDGGDGLVPGEGVGLLAVVVLEGAGVGKNGGGGLLWGGFGGGGGGGGGGRNGGGGTGKEAASAWVFTCGEVVSGPRTAMVVVGVVWRGSVFPVV